MNNTYSRVSLASLSIFVGLVILMSAAVLCVYGGIYGFDSIKQQLAGASKVMLAAAPTQQTPVAYTMGNPSAPAGQYICLQHGAVGMPNFNQAGAPQCPLCSRFMQFNCGGMNAGPTIDAVRGGG